MEIKKEYGLVILTGLALNLHAFKQGARIVDQRKKIFSKDFLEKQFGSVHMSQLNEEIQRGGYPDTGCGLYSNKISYANWYRFNILQRIHLNYLQNLPLMLTGLFTAGIFQPIYASALGGIILFGRFLYGTFYPKKGGAMNVWRECGAVISFIASLINVVIAGYSAIKLLKN